MQNIASRKSANEIKAEREKAAEYLKESLKPGDTVYTILRKVSASGMSRCLDLYTIRDNCPLRLTWNAAKVLESRYDRKAEALRVDGAGMDMGYSTVTHLSYKLFGEAYALKHQWL